MTKDKLWQFLISEHPGMEAEIVSMRCDGFRRFFDTVYDVGFRAGRLEMAGAGTILDGLFANGGN